MGRIIRGFTLILLVRISAMGFAIPAFSFFPSSLAQSICAGDGVDAYRPSSLFFHFARIYACIHCINILNSTPAVSPSVIVPDQVYFVDIHRRDKTRDWAHAHALLAACVLVRICGLLALGSQEVARFDLVWLVSVFLVLYLVVFILFRLPQWGFCLLFWLLDVYPRCLCLRIHKGCTTLLLVSLVPVSMFAFVVSSFSAVCGVSQFGCPGSLHTRGACTLGHFLSLLFFFFLDVHTQPVFCDICIASACTRVPAPIHVISCLPNTEERASMSMRGMLPWH